MINLENNITLNEDSIHSPNLVDQFTDMDLHTIGEVVWENYSTDMKSREAWERRTDAAMDLAMQIQKEKTFPWPNCSNVAFPLVTIAALQFHSRAYPTLLDGDDVVKCRTIGNDPDGKKEERAKRVSDHMSWQILEQDENWEPEFDRALLSVPIVGTAFKKSYYSAEKGHNTSEFVMARDLVLNYWAKSVEDCPVKTHCIPTSRNTIHTRILQGTFRDIREEEWFQSDAPTPEETKEQLDSDNRRGQEMPDGDRNTPFILLEQHLWMDLDGDGYEEPYIITIEKNTHTVLRIVCRFNREEDIERTEKGEIIQIHAEEYFTKIPFIPSPDGGIMDIGFGVLLGPLNESTNSAINQLFDSGTIANTSGGFLGRGAKLKGGVYKFSPFRWNPVDSQGDDIKKSVLPLPVRQPSEVIFNLLSLLIEYTEKVSGAVDISTGGNPGQNTPATTSQTMVEQGQKVYSAIYKRIWKSLKREFKKLYQLNALYLPDGPIYFAGSTQAISRADYLGDPSAVIPTADPNITSDRQKFIQARALLEVGKDNPLYNQDAVNKTYLRSIKINDIDSVYLGTEKMQPPQPDVKLQIEQMKTEVKLKDLEWQKLQFIASLLEQRRLNEAKIVSLYAQAALYEEQSGGIEAANQIAAFRAIVDSLQKVNADIVKQIEQLGGIPGGNPNGNRQLSTPTMGGMETPPNDQEVPTGNQAETGGTEGGMG